jgi:hypothetical protein
MNSFLLVTYSICSVHCDRDTGCDYKVITIPEELIPTTMAATTRPNTDPCPSALKVAEAGEESRETMIYTYRHVKTGSSLSGDLGWSDLTVEPERRTCRNGEGGRPRRST